jgi:hypothetical protein
MAIHFPNATFIHIPRTAGKSFELWVTQNISIYDNQHGNCKFDVAQATWANLGTVFTFVRNPYARLVSMFHYMGQQARYRIELKSKGLDIDPTVHSTIDEDIKTYGLYRKGFEHWLNNKQEQLSSVEDINFWTNAGFTSQVNWLCGHIPNIIIKTENINQDFVVIQNLLECYMPLPNINASEHGHYKSYYNLSTKKLATEIIQADLDAFGYEF